MAFIDKIKANLFPTIISTKILTTTIIILPSNIFPHLLRLLTIQISIIIIMQILPQISKDILQIKPRNYIQIILQESQETREILQLI
jgi:hypothetical protein